MNLRNFLTLTIREFDFNLVAQNPVLIKKLRKLTLYPNSGLNHELTWMLNEAHERELNCQVLLAYRMDKLVAWALLSKEDTDFIFFNSEVPFNSEDGWLFQVYVDPKYRRQGIASELYKLARERTKDEVLCVCPWDDASTLFYHNFIYDGLNRWI